MRLQSRKNRGNEKAMKNIGGIFTSSVFALLVLLSGCSAIQERPAADTGTTGTQATVPDRARDKPAQGSVAAPPPEVSAALMPALQVGDMRLPSEPVEPRFDISVKQAQARSFFMSLVEGTPYNMVVHPSVEGEISLTLKNVTIREVMDTVRDVYGYEYQKTSSGYIVLPRRLQSKIFYVNYLNLKRAGESRTQVSSGEVSSAGSSTTGSTTNTSTTTTTGGSTSRESLSGSNIKTESETDLWKELDAAVQSIVGTGEGRSVIVSPQSSLIVVRAMPSELRDVEHFLSQAQNSLQRQVILEAKIMEVQLNDGFQSGINWAALSEDSNGNSILGGQVGGGSIFNNGTSEISGNEGTLNPGAFAPLENTAVSAFGGVFSLSLKVNDFTAFIELLKTQGNVEILSSPRVSTVNNQKAVIKVGTDEFFVTAVSSTTTTGTATTTIPEVTLTPFFSGIALDVTPQISPAGDVILHIHPSISDVKDQTKVITIADQTQSLPLALSTVRETDNIVRVKNGQIVVIGGLMQDTLSDQDAGVPYLKDVPIFGNMFKHKLQTKKKTELVILLKTTIVNQDSVWEDAGNVGSDRMRELYRDAFQNTRQGRP